MMGLEQTVALEEARDRAEAMLKPPDDSGRWGLRAVEALGDAADCIDLLLEREERKSEERAGNRLT
jgi:hypothetical protein